MAHSTRGPGCSGPQERCRDSDNRRASGLLAGVFFLLTTYVRHGCINRGEVQVLGLFDLMLGGIAQSEFPWRPATSHKQWCPYYHGATVQQVPLYIKGKENVGSDWGIITSRLSRSGIESLSPEVDNESEAGLPLALTSAQSLA